MGRHAGGNGVHSVLGSAVRSRLGSYRGAARTSCSWLRTWHLSLRERYTNTQAYAADGYARVKRGLAVVVTTFGVGELSALW